MIRDMELIKQILQKVEELDKSKLNLPIEGYDQLTVNEHIYLCNQANLLEATITRSSQGKAEVAVVDRLTMKGHDFLQHARNNTLWNNVKAKFKEKAVSYSVEMFYLALKQEAIHFLPK